MSTLGIDHLGLTVADLDASLGFFTECLGWRQVGGRPEYPSAFITDGVGVLTLWQQKEQGADFDRRANVGLHHFALKVADRETLDALFDQVAGWPGVEVEFAPEFSGTGPKIHFMIREPGGTRVEFAYDPR
ncbi:MAG: VOC family protein [Silicimonas sp.]|nr:VOC family protein [Silicimonas sp.]